MIAGFWSACAAGTSPGRIRTFDLAVNPDVSGLALPAEEVFADPAGGFHGLDLLLATHGLAASGMGFGPNQRPWAMLGGVLALGPCGVVMLSQSTVEVVRLADVETPLGILDDVDGEHGPSPNKAGRPLLDSLCTSPGRIRTFDLAVNSRSLYQLSYRGIGRMQYCSEF